jgi:hypothetical protein
MRSFYVIVLLLISHAALAQFSERQPDLPLTSIERRQIVDSLTERIRDEYVFPEMAARVAKELRRRQQLGMFEKIASSNQFADSINTLLHQISNDKHLSVLYSHDTVPGKRVDNRPIPDFIRRFAMENNYGFPKVEVLPGNIGYMKLQGFFPFEEATDKAIAAFDFLAGTRALIVDLRENSGGDAGLANFVLSFFFDAKPVELAEVHFRDEQKTQKFWTSFYVPGKRYIGKPVYILTSSATFSGGEGFAYTLQSYKKATIVGEATGGGANMGDLIRINEHFVLNLPVGRPLNPVTDANWEGIGVQPDIRVQTSKALDAAHAAALEQILPTVTDDQTRQIFKGFLNDLRNAPK